AHCSPLQASLSPYTTLFRSAGRHLLVDCGRGVLMRAAAAGSGASLFDRVLLTHLHSDHTTDFNDVLTTRWVTSPAPNPLRVVGRSEEHTSELQSRENLVCRL